MKLSPLIALILLLSTNVLYSQNNLLNGSVRDYNGQKIDYFTIEILSDSVSILQGSFVNGEFSLNLPYAKEYTLKILSFGYEDKYIDLKPIDIKDSIICRLSEKVYSLDAITITASKPKLIMKNNNYILSVDKTYLSNEGSINNVLIKLPFVLLDSNNRVSIVGKNNVVVFIDNRRILHNQELESISPINIKDIQLINEPGSQYDANADAVILIRTKKENKEDTSFSVRTQKTVGKAFSFDINPNLNYNHRNINIYLDYIYSNSKNKSKENTLTRNLINNNENNIFNKQFYRATNNTYTVGLNYLFNKKNRVAFQLLGWNTKVTPNVDIDNYYIKGENENIVQTKKDIKSKENHYNFSVNYESIFSDSQNLTTLLNYTIHNSDTDEKIAETQISDKLNHFYNFKSKNKVVDYELNYNWFIEKFDIHLTSGIRISYISNNSNSFFLEDNNETNNRFTYNYDFKEIIPAYFLDMTKNINNVNTYIGLRAEHTSFRGNYEGEKVVDSRYVNFFPNLGLNWKINDKNKLNINYSKKISRPSFQSLSPNIRYDNAFFFRQGNPELLPTIIDDISLSHTINKLRLNIGYRHKKNSTLYTYYQDKINEDITIVKLVNHKSMNFFYVESFYQFRLKRLTSSNSFTYTKPFATIKYMNGDLKLDKPAFFLKTSNDFLLSENISLFLDFIYNDLGETLLEKKKRMYNLSAGISLSFLNKKLNLNIFANDILNTYTFKDFRTYGDYDVIHEYKPDNTFVQVNIRYNFSTSKKKYKIQNNSASTLRRL